MHSICNYIYTVDETVEDTGESKQADTKVEDSDNQMTVVDDVGNSSPGGSASKQRSISRSRSRSSYSSNKSGKVKSIVLLNTIISSDSKIYYEYGN